MAYDDNYLNLNFVDYPNTTDYSGFMNTDNSVENAFGATGPDYSWAYDYTPSFLSPTYVQDTIENLPLGVTDDSLLTNAGSWLGDNWKGLLSTGLGALSMYGNYRNSKASADAMAKNAETARLQYELANRQAKAEAADSLASRASIANILASRGRLSPNNTNPWLNYVYKAQDESGLTPQGANPFAVYTTGQEVGSGMDLASLLAGLEAQNAAAPRPKMAGGGLLRGALKALRRSNLEGLATHTMKPHELPAEWVADNASAISDDYMNMIRSLNQRLDNPMDEAAEREFIQRYLSEPHGKASGGSTNAGPVRGHGGGQDDVVQAEMAPGEYVFDAESVSALGDGNNEEGARKLDQMRMNIRAHKRNGPLNDIPPRAHSPLKYLK